jgi:hypothetical protein
VAATVMAMLEIYKRRYELSETTENRVAALVAPRSSRDGDDGAPAEPVSVAAEAPADSPAPDGPTEATGST